MSRRHLQTRYIYVLYFLSTDLPLWTVYVGCTSDPAVRRQQHRRAWPWPFFMVLLHSQITTARDAERWESAYRSAAWSAGCHVASLTNAGVRLIPPNQGNSWTRGLPSVVWTTAPATTKLSHTTWHTQRGEELTECQNWSLAPHLIVALDGVSVTLVRNFVPFDKRRLQNLL